MTKLEKSLYTSRKEQLVKDAKVARKNGDTAAEERALMELRFMK